MITTTPDPRRCQALLVAEHGIRTQCPRPPEFVAQARDGIGAMSLCRDCAGICRITVEGVQIDRLRNTHAAANGGRFCGHHRRDK